MPIACSPKARAWINLKIDEDTPEETRGAFSVRCVTSEEATTSRQFIEDAWKLPDAEAQIVLRDYLAGFVRGWRNIKDPRNASPLAYSAENIPKALTPLEMFELAGLIMARTTLLEIEVKKSGSQSGSIGAPSARIATEASAINPSSSGAPAPNATAATRMVVQSVAADDASA